jgi:hypothetical protein
MATAVYPNGIVQWTPRTDQVNVIYANDVNTLAVELGAVESTVGTQPQIENAAPVAGNIPYATMGARLSAAMNGANLPACVVLNTPGIFVGSGKQVFNTYTTQEYDPYKIWNGQDLTIPCNGYWSIRADQKWNQGANEFVGLNILFLYLNGTWIDSAQWDWTAWLNTPLALRTQASNDLGSQGWSLIHWEGLLHKGDRIQMLSANATYCPGLQVTKMSLKAMCHRTITNTTFVSG